MSGAHIAYHVCPACGRRKATGHSVTVGLGDDVVTVGAKICQQKGCRATSIRGVVIRGGGVTIRTSPEAAAAVAAAIERHARATRQQAANLIEEAAHASALAVRVRNLHAT